MVRPRTLTLAVALVVAACANAQTVVRVPAGATVVVQQDESPAKKIIAESAPVVTQARAEDRAAVAATRTSAIQEAWMAIGARAGLAARSTQLNMLAKANADKLDAVFNFRPLILEGESEAAYELPPVIPPVVVEAEKAYTFQDGRTVRTADKVYRVVAQARFGLAPTWRTYLIKSYPADSEVDRSLQPRTPDEKAIADNAYKAGIAVGERQAEQIFEINLNNLARDFNGMVQYRLLLANGMISRPFVARSDFGVTGDDQQLNLNEAVLRITELPSFVVSPGRWNADLTRGADQSGGTPAKQADARGAQNQAQTDSQARPDKSSANASPRVATGPQVMFTATELEDYKRVGAGAKQTSSPQSPAGANK